LTAALKLPSRREQKVPNFNLNKKERAVLPFLDLSGGERIHELGVGILGRVAPALGGQLPHAGEVQAARAQQQRGDNHQARSAALPQQTHRQLYQVQVGCNKKKKWSDQFEK
jgi:hypothetical protein